MSKYILSREQERIVNKIVDNAQKALNCNDERFDLIVDAVTGSGKTLMMTNAISRILSNNKDKKIVIIVATPSTADLHVQIFNKMNKYLNSMPMNERFVFNLIQSPSKANKCEGKPKLVPENHKVFIIGKASFTQSSLYNTTGAFDIFVENLKDYNVLYFRDEAHYGNKEKNNKYYSDFENKIQGLARFNCFLSATPNFDSNFDVISLTAKDLENDNIKLLKSDKFEFLKDDEQDIELITDEILLENAIEKYQIVKNDYVENNIPINPAMLIQINNDTDAKRDLEKHNQFNKNLEMIINFIENKSNPKNSLKYYITFDTDANVKKTNTRYDKLSFEQLSNNECDIDVIIFKVGAAIGWDIPRANMLVQLRHVNSENLQTQTIGRIMRFPNPHDKNLRYKKCADSYYIYSNIPVNQNKRFTYQIKKCFLEQKQRFLISEIINKNEIANSYLESKNELKNEIKKTINNNLGFYKNKLDELFESEVINIDQNISKTNKRYSELKIYNVLELKIYNDKLANKNIDAFEIIDNLKSYYLNLNWNFDWEQFRFLIFNLFIDEIKSKLAKKIKVAEPKYENFSNELQQYKFNEILDNKKTSFEAYIKGIEDLYYFEVLPKKSTKFYFDSRNEVLVFDVIKNFIIKNKNKLNIHFLFKNPINSGIGKIEYIDENVQIHIEHVDFVLRFSVNNIIKTLYIEVKGGYKETNNIQYSLSDLSENNYLSINTDDYNETKTKNVLNSFKIISQQHNNDFFLSLVYVDSQEGKVKSSATTKTRVANYIGEEELSLEHYLKDILF